MTHMTTILAVLAILCGAVAGAFAGDAVYVQSAKARVLSSPDARSPATATASRGEKLEVKEKADGWYRVSYGGETGWISGFLVSNKPPMPRVSLLDDTAPSLKAQARRRASTVTAAGGSRGLMSDDRARSSQGETYDYEALHAVETSTVTDDELAEFTELLQPR